MVVIDLTHNQWTGAQDVTEFAPGAAPPGRSGAPRLPLAGERCQPFRAASVLRGEDGDGQAVLHQALPARLPCSAGLPHLNPRRVFATIMTVHPLETTGFGA